MKVLIAILSCKRDQVFHQQARETWLKDCPVDYKFFLGCPVIASDEVRVQAPDTYRLNADKMKRVVEYALEKEYDFLFKCDIDTYVCVPRLLKSEFEKHDFIGFNGNYGGSGYWLSRKAMSILVDCPTVRPGDRCRLLDDGWVGYSLSQHGIFPFQDKRYHSLTKEGPTSENDLITSHWYSDHNCNPERVIKSKERLNLIPSLHLRAKEICN
jgi:hypothetical protein